MLKGHPGAQARQTLLGQRRQGSGKQAQFLIKAGKNPYPQAGQVT